MSKEPYQLQYYTKSGALKSLGNNAQKLLENDAFVDAYQFVMGMESRGEVLSLEHYAHALNAEKITHSGAGVSGKHRDLKEVVAEVEGFFDALPTDAPDIASVNTLEGLAEKGNWSPLQIAEAQRELSALGFIKRELMPMQDRLEHLRDGLYVGPAEIDALRNFVATYDAFKKSDGALVAEIHFHRGQATDTDTRFARLIDVCDMLRNFVRLNSEQGYLETLYGESRREAGSFIQATGFCFSKPSHIGESIETDSEFVDKINAAMRADVRKSMSGAFRVKDVDKWFARQQYEKSTKEAAREIKEYLDNDSTGFTAFQSIGALDPMVKTRAENLPSYLQYIAQGTILTPEQLADFADQIETHVQNRRDNPAVIKLQEFLSKHCEELAEVTDAIYPDGEALSGSQSVGSPAIKGRKK